MQPEQCAAAYWTPSPTPSTVSVKCAALDSSFTSALTLRSIPFSVECALSFAGVLFNRRSRGRGGGLDLCDFSHDAVRMVLPGKA